MRGLNTIEAAKQDVPDILTTKFQGQSPLVQCEVCTGCKDCVFGITEKRGEIDLSPAGQKKAKEKEEKSEKDDARVDKGEGVVKIGAIARRSAAQVATRGAEAERGNPVESAAERDARLRSIRGNDQLAGKPAAAMQQFTPILNLGTPATAQTLKSISQQAGVDYMTLAMTHANSMANAVNAMARRSADQTKQQATRAREAAQDTYLQRPSASAERGTDNSRDATQRAERARASAYQDLAHSAEFKAEMERQARRGAQVARGREGSSANQDLAHLAEFKAEMERQARRGAQVARGREGSSAPAAEQARAATSGRAAIYRAPDVAASRSTVARAAAPNGAALNGTVRSAAQSSAQTAAAQPSQRGATPGPRVDQRIDQRISRNGTAEAARTPQPRQAQTQPAQKTGEVHRPAPQERRAAVRTAQPSREENPVQRRAQQVQRNAEPAERRQRPAPRDPGRDQTLQDPAQKVRQAVDNRNPRAQKIEPGNAPARQAAGAENRTDPRPGRTDRVPGRPPADLDNKKDSGRGPDAPSQGPSRRTAPDRDRDDSRGNPRGPSNPPGTPPAAAPGRGKSPAPDLESRREFSSKPNTDRDPAPDSAPARPPARGSFPGRDRGNVPDLETRTEFSPKPGRGEEPRETRDTAPARPPASFVERVRTGVQERVTRVVQSVEKLFDSIIRRDVAKRESPAAEVEKKITTRISDLVQDVRAKAAGLLARALGREKNPAPQQETEKRRGEKKIQTETGRVERKHENGREERRVPAPERKAVAPERQTAIVQAKGPVQEKAVERPLGRRITPEPAARESLVRGTERAVIRRLDARIKLLSSKLRKAATLKNKLKVRLIAERRRKLIKLLQDLHIRSLEKELRRAMQSKLQTEKGYQTKEHEDFVAIPVHPEALDQEPAPE